MYRYLLAFFILAGLGIAPVKGHAQVQGQGNVRIVPMVVKIDGKVVSRGASDADFANKNFTPNQNGPYPIKNNSSVQMEVDIYNPIMKQWRNITQNIHTKYVVVGSRGMVSDDGKVTALADKISGAKDYGAPDKFTVMIQFNDIHVSQPGNVPGGMAASTPVSFQIIH